MNDNCFTIAVTLASNNLPDGTIEERIKFSMKNVRENKSDIFWLYGNAGSELMFRVAIGAVMIKATDEEKDLIEKSLKPIQALSALMSGVPVDMSQVDTENILPLHQWWTDSDKEK